MKTSRKPTVCWSCKKGPLRQVLREESVEVGGSVYRATLPWQECSNCGESTVHFRDLQAFALAVSLVFARRGSVAPDALKYMRKTLGLTAVEFGDLLGLRPETISRIENGRIPADRRTVALLGALVEDEAAGKSATRARLLALRRPKKAAKVVRVAL